MSDKESSPTSPDCLPAWDIYSMLHCGLQIVSIEKKMTEENKSEDGLLTEIGEGIAEANATASKGPLAILLNPAAQIWSKKLEDFAKWTVGEQKKNIASHKQAVLEENPDFDKKEPTLQMVKRIETWHEEAKNYGSEDSDEAALWRAVLDAIINNSSEAEQLLRVAHNLSLEDISELGSLQGIAEQETGLNKDQMKQFQLLGLVNKEADGHVNYSKVRVNAPNASQRLLLDNEMDARIYISLLGAYTFFYYIPKIVNIFINETIITPLIFSATIQLAAIAFTGIVVKLIIKNVIKSRRIYYILSPLGETLLNKLSLYSPKTDGD